MNVLQFLFPLAERRLPQGRLELSEAALSEDERKFIPKTFRVNYMPAQGHRLLSVRAPRNSASAASAAMEGISTNVGACIPELSDPAYKAHQLRLKAQTEQAESQRPTTALLLDSQLRRMREEQVQRAQASATAAGARRRMEAAAAAPAEPIDEGFASLRASRSSNTIMNLFEVFPYWKVTKAMEYLPPGSKRETVKGNLQSYGNYMSSGKYQGSYRCKPEFHTTLTREVFNRQLKADEEEAALAADA